MPTSKLLLSGMAAVASLPFLQVDAFTQDPFGGNPAGIVFLEAPRNAAWLQAVAAEMNLSETAFLLRRADGRFDLRWFTPAVEVTLCGHATLASAHALWSTGRADGSAPIVFETLSGALTATPASARTGTARTGTARPGTARPGTTGPASARTGADGAITIDLPLRAVTPATLPVDVVAALGIQPIAVHAAGKGPGGIDYIVECADEATVTAARPDMGPLKAVDGGVILTARASTRGWDFVSRYFVPAFGIDEDPVTGSAHCALAPYWAERLGRATLTARQVSRRGGTLQVAVDGDRVRLTGHAVTVLSGELLA
jgi:PhzF family phenazine biosynthesis protein